MELSRKNKPIVPCHPNVYNKPTKSQANRTNGLEMVAERVFAARKDSLADALESWTRPKAAD